MCARAAGGGGAVDWREERPVEGLTARAGEVEAMAAGTATARDGAAAMKQREVGGNSRNFRKCFLYRMVL